MPQQPIRVLLVADEPLVLIGLQGLLDWGAHGYEICGTARNGEAALALIEKTLPHIVIADIRMPLMDGLELARRCHEKGSLPVFLMLTSYEEFALVRSAMGAGAVDYLIKLELTPESLAAAVVQRERAFRTQAGPELQAGLMSYRDRFFLRLYARQIADEGALLYLSTFSRLREQKLLYNWTPAFPLIHSPACWGKTKPTVGAPQRGVSPPLWGPPFFTVFAPFP